MRQTIDTLKIIHDGLKEYVTAEIRNAALGGGGEVSYITPENFGAVGDGITDDYNAFKELMEYLDTVTYAYLEFGKNKVYKINRYIGDGISPTATRFIIQNKNYLQINGNDSKIVFKGDFEQTAGDLYAGGYYSTKHTVGFTILGCNNVNINNLEMDGQSNLSTTDGVINSESSDNNGFVILGCNNVKLSNIYSHNFTCDAFIVGDGDVNVNNSVTRKLSENVQIDNCKFEYGARNSVTVGCVKNVSFNNCIIRNAGLSNGSFPMFAPGLCVDIEPDFGLGDGLPSEPTNITFYNCDISNGKGGILASPQPFVYNVTFDTCLLKDYQGDKTYSINIESQNTHINNCEIILYKELYIDKYTERGTTYFTNNDIKVYDCPLIVEDTDSESPVIFENNRIRLYQTDSSKTYYPIYNSSNLLIFRYNQVYFDNSLTTSIVLLKGCRECIGNYYTTNRTTGTSFTIDYEYARVVHGEVFAPDTGYVQLSAGSSSYDFKDKQYSNIYQSLSDSRLETTDKTIVGAINEVRSSIGNGSSTGGSSSGGSSSGSNPSTGGSSPTLSWYNAKNYGATGDGSTNDATALNTLIRTVHDAGGGVIYCPKGIYILNEQMNWLSGVSLVGDGVGHTIFKTVRNGPTYDVSHSAIGYDAANGYGIADGEPFKNCHFRDFEIDGSGVVSTDGHYCVRIKGIYMQYLVNCTFDNLYIHDTMATGLGVDYLDKSYITNVTARNCGRGFDVLTGGSLGGAGIGIGTGAMESENLVISNCMADGNGHYGIFLEHQKLFESTLNYEAQGVTISNCISKNNRNYGIGVRGGKNVIIDSCQSYGNQKHGIYCYTLETNDLTISNCQIFGNVQHGIVIYDILMNGLKIHNNTFLNNNQDIRFQSLKTGTGNIMIDSNYFKNSKVGIHFDTPNNPDYVVIQGNMFLGCQEFGISVQDGNQYIISSLFIKNNVFKDIGTTDIVGKGICLWVDGQVGEITNNTFHKKKSDISMNGVHFISCKLTNYRIRNNYFVNCNSNYYQQNDNVFTECDNEFSNS